jgi:hypothetical protein
LQQRLFQKQCPFLAADIAIVSVNLMRLNELNSVSKNDRLHPNTKKIASMKTNSVSRAARFNVGVVLGLALCSVGLMRASAQIGGGGTTNYIPLWTSPTTLGNSSIYQLGINLGIGTTSPLGALDVHDAADPFTILGTNSHANGIGVFGTSGASRGGTGVYGQSTNNTGIGVFGINGSPGGIAVEGTAGALGIAIKGVGKSASATSSQLTERPLAVWGSTNQIDGVGLAGTADDGFGVLAINNSQHDAAGFFQNTATGGAAAAVEGKTSSSAGYGVYGIATSTDTSGLAYGVYGQAVTGPGVYGYSTGNSGVVGVSNTTVECCTQGAAGINMATSGNNNGVYGEAHSPDGVGGLFENQGGGLILLGRVNPSANLFTVDTNGSGFFAGDLQANGNGTFGPTQINGQTQINGNLVVTGAITAGVKDFKIDHPLDPANKYLYHTSVESPDMMNVYNGNVTTDENGSATVELPDYFEALNRDFRYQLTVIGQFAQAMVAEEISHNHFTIRTSQPSVKVSWQVTGIRQDAWANAYRTPTEVDKPAEKRGTYLYPELYGASADKNTDAKSQQ